MKIVNKWDVVCFVQVRVEFSIEVMVKRLLTMVDVISIVIMT